MTVTDLHARLANRDFLDFDGHVSVGAVASGQDCLDNLPIITCQEESLLVEGRLRSVIRLREIGVDHHLQLPEAEFPNRVLAHLHGRAAGEDRQGKDRGEHAEQADNTLIRVHGRQDFCSYDTQTISRFRLRCAARAAQAGRTLPTNFWIGLTPTCFCCSASMPFTAAYAPVMVVMMHTLWA